MSIGFANHGVAALPELIFLRRHFLVAVGAHLLLILPAPGGEPSAPTKTLARLIDGRPTKIVCIGDSVTGIYYHTGGRRAYPEMLAIALKRQFPRGEMCVVNAGVSGTTAADGLARLERDVLMHQPDLVTIMFGLNDMAAYSTDMFRENLAQLIQRCQEAGSEVLLCTPNAVEETKGRPISKLAEYVDVVRALGNEHQVPVVDICQAFEEVRRKDAAEFSLLLSDPIHPNMDGHKLTASVLAQAITGRGISLADEPSPAPSLPHTLSLLRAGKRIRVLAMPPLDSMLPAAVKQVISTAEIDVTSWDVNGKSLGEIEADAGRVREARADLVGVAIPWMFHLEPELEFARTYGGILNRSLSFGKQEWDVLVVPPSVTCAAASADQQRQDRLVRRLIRAQDLPVLEQPGDGRNSLDVIAAWLKRQLVLKESSENATQTQVIKGGRSQ